MCVHVTVGEYTVLYGLSFNVDGSTDIRALLVLTVAFRVYF